MTTDSPEFVDALISILAGLAALGAVVLVAAVPALASLIDRMPSTTTTERRDP
jgi:hypothetical protein